MTDYCIDLNLDIKIFNTDLHPVEFLKTLPAWNDKHSLKKKGNKHFKVPQEFINRDFINFFTQRGLYLVVVEVFYTTPNGSIGVHSDTTSLSDVGKINWVYGGSESEMHWYQVNDTYNPEVTNAKRGVGPTVANSPTLRFLKTDVDLVHSQAVGCPSIVQVGVPHNVTNGPDDRVCIGAVFGSREFKRRLSLRETAEMFKEFITGGP